MLFSRALRAALPVALLAGTLASARADVKLHNLFTDHCVLQQGKPVPVWGTARPGEKVTVVVPGQEQAATADADGRWMIRLKPLKATNQPFTLVAKGDNTVEVQDVMAGEVWLASGQSNMQWHVAISENPDSVAATANDPKLRILTVPRRPADTPERDLDAKWEVANSQNIRDFSAVAFSFAKSIRAARNVPVGIISTNYGGTPAEAWTRLEALREIDSLKYYADLGRPEKPNPNYRASLYNAMIAPLIPYAIKGAIWYQGESNAGKAYEYRTLFPAMIANWRKDFGQGDFPFFFVQLAPFMAKKAEPGDSAWAELREAQLMTLKASPKTGMAVITDLGDEKDIHPRPKGPVGERLALAARAIAYGEKLVYSGPVLDKMEAKGDRVVLRFKSVGSGLSSKGGDLMGFAVAGADGKFVNARASLVGKDRVEVYSPLVSMPVAVRYGWADFPVVNLYNAEGLPATPFRTDDFPGVTQPKK